MAMRQGVKRPSLGITAQEIYRNWEAAEHMPSSHTVGFIPAYGVFDWRNGEICRVIAPTSETLATYRRATLDELQEIDKAIHNGTLQIERRPITGLARGRGTMIDSRANYHDVGIAVLHQATGRALVEPEYL
jgi:hypothetical protein